MAPGHRGTQLRLDQELRGSPSEVQGLRDALGHDVLISGIGDAQPRAGHDVVTSIDKFIQYRLERALEVGVREHHAKAAALAWTLARERFGNGHRALGKPQ